MNSKSCFWLVRLGGVVLALLTGVTLVRANDRLELSAVGPRPAGELNGVSDGYLKVFSSTEQTQWGENTNYYIHSHYRIFTMDGKLLRTIANHNDKTDEEPEKVALAPGTYKVVAHSEKDGVVSVPVVIKRAQLTTVHLDDTPVAAQDVFNPAKAVKTPSGQIVGWKAS